MRDKILKLQCLFALNFSVDPGYSEFLSCVFLHGMDEEYVLAILYLKRIITEPNIIPPISIKITTYMKGEPTEQSC